MCSVVLWWAALRMLLACALWWVRGCTVRAHYTPNEYVLWRRARAGAGVCADAIMQTDVVEKPVRGESPIKV